LTTAILSAFAQEQTGLIELLERPERVQRAGRYFWRGHLQGQPVVLALSKLGKVAAATTATTVIEAFGAKQLVFTGVAGGVGPGVQVGDVVLATDFVQHDMDCSPLFPRYEIPLYGQSRFACDAALNAHLLIAAQQALVGLGADFDAQLHADLPRVHQGLIASGDRFVSSATEVAALVQGLTQAGHPPLAVEMEGAAVAQVCHDYGVPFAAVRTISDRADDSAHVDFNAFVRDTASRYAVGIVLGFLDGIPTA
jgi:adenosylhomocysteine nucleosidase